MPEQDRLPVPKLEIAVEEFSDWKFDGEEPSEVKPKGSKRGGGPLPRDRSEDVAVKGEKELKKNNRPASGEVKKKKSEEEGRRSDGENGAKKEKKPALEVPVSSPVAPSKKRLSGKPDRKAKKDEIKKGGKKDGKKELTQEEKEKKRKQEEAELRELEKEIAMLEGMVKKGK